jgi:excisionase family DNA binding protein
MPFLLLWPDFSNPSATALERRRFVKALKNVVGAAELLSLSVWTVRALERQGALKAVRLGRRVLFEQDELERFVARSRENQRKENLAPEVLDAQR